MNLVCRNSFPKLSNFPQYFTQVGKFRGEAQCWKACRSREKESKQSEIRWKQSELVRSISKIEKRWEFVRALWNEQCPKNSFKRLCSVKGLVLVEKASFSTEFRSESHSSGVNCIGQRLRVKKMADIRHGVGRECLLGFYGEHNSKNRKGSCRDVTWRGLVGTWRLIRDWSYIITFGHFVPGLLTYLSEVPKWFKGPTKAYRRHEHLN